MSGLPQWSSAMQRDPNTPPVISEPLVTPGRVMSDKMKAFREAHTGSDVDESMSALHHTLGTSPNQAMPGNSGKLFQQAVDYTIEHTNDVEDLALTGAAGWTHSSRLSRWGRTISVRISEAATIAHAANAACLTLPAIHRPYGLLQNNVIALCDLAGNPYYFALASTGAVTAIKAVPSGVTLIGTITYIAKYQ